MRTQVLHGLSGTTRDARQAQMKSLDGRRGRGVGKACVGRAFLEAVRSTTKPPMADSNSSDAGLDAQAARVPRMRDVVAILIAGGVAVDANAGDGTATAAMASHATTVHAYETHPGRFRNLVRSMPRNVVLHQETLGTSHGLKTVEVRLGKQDGTRYESMLIRVQKAMLDDLSDANVDLVRIEAGGETMDALHGGARLIAKHRPSFLMLFGTDEARAPVESFFVSREYRCMDCRPAAGRPSQGIGMETRRDAVFVAGERLGLLGRLGVALKPKRPPRRAESR